MLKKISKIPFKGTPEQEAKLRKVIEECKHDKSLLMHVMQQAQQIYDYLPFEVQVMIADGMDIPKEYPCRRLSLPVLQVMIADGMDIPLEKVYGVSTFYAQFALSPKGKYKVSVCLGTACYVKGSQEILDRICERLEVEPDECTPDGVFSVEACRCIGACGLAPVMMVNDEVYGKITADDVDGILDKYME